MVLIDSLGLGGAESLLIPYVQAVRRKNIEVKVAALEERADLHNKMVDSLRDLGVEPHFLQIPRLLSPTGVPRLARYFRSSCCDVVHAHLGYSITLGVPEARLARRTIVGTFHHIPEDLPLRERVKERLSIEAASSSDRCIFVSEAQRSEFHRRYPRRTRQWTVIKNGIDVAEFAGEPVAFPDELGIPAGVPVVTMLAALRGPKGHRYAVDAWPFVRSKVPGARLLFVGSGPEEADLRRQVADLGLQGAVIFAGFRRDVGRLLRASSVVLSASKIEALPTVIMEAAAASKPVIATNVGGTRELVDDGVTGVLIPFGRSARLGQAVADLLLDPRSLSDMGRSANRRALTEFDSDTWVGALRTVYGVATTVRRGS